MTHYGLDMLWYNNGVQARQTMYAPLGELTSETLWDENANKTRERTLFPNKEYAQIDWVENGDVRKTYVPTKTKINQLNKRTNQFNKSKTTTTIN